MAGTDAVFPVEPAQTLAGTVTVASGRARTWIVVESEVVQPSLVTERSSLSVGPLPTV